MGKTKQAKEKKFNRNVEISAPILDPEIIKAIHSPPRGRLDIKHGGFKALLADMNSRDSTDELSPLNENHIPSYIGISCAVSGYSNYSSYTKRPSASPLSKSDLGDNNKLSHTPNRSRTTSPLLNKYQNENHHVHHITIDKNSIQSPDDERKELTEKLIASATESRRSPSPIPPTEDDRHHGTYVGARYCPLPPPSKIVQHIPLLGIDDDLNPDEYPEDQNKVEQKIANLYGDEFVDDWRESMTHKAKKEIHEDQNTSDQQLLIKNPKDLVTLKPAPVKKPEPEPSAQVVDIAPPNVKVLAGVEKEFLNKLLTDENPPVPSPPPYLQSPVQKPEVQNQISSVLSEPDSSPKNFSPSSPNLPSSGSEEIVDRIEETKTKIPASDEEHIVYEIRTQSPVDNEASPVRVISPQPESLEKPSSDCELDATDEKLLVSFSPEPSAPDTPMQEEQPKKQLSTESEINDGHYYMNLLSQETSFILEKIAEAEALLENHESELDEDSVGRIRSAIGKANLLVNKKCNQFRELCEANINKVADEQYACLNDDLAGFWDMIRLQFEDVRKSFDAIRKAEINDYKSETGFESTQVKSVDEETPKEFDSSDKVKSNKPKLSQVKDQERRERLREHINQMKQNQANKVDELISEGEVLEQVGCDLIDTVTEAPPATIEQQAEDQLFSLIGVQDGSTSRPDYEEAEESSKPREEMVDLLG